MRSVYYTIKYTQSFKLLRELVSLRAGPIGPPRHNVALYFGRPFFICGLHISTAMLILYSIILLDDCMK
jgi:hypothetical protein